MPEETGNWVIRAEGGRSLVVKSTNGCPIVRKFRFDKSLLSSALGREFPALLEDLLDLASVIYSADRIARRPRFRKHSGHSLGQRQFHIEVPVSDPIRWSQPSVLHPLTEALSLFTEDCWHFEFYARAQVPRALQLNLPAPPSAAVLFSGGLDSLAGLALQLSESRPRSIVALSCGTSSRLFHLQREQLRAMHACNQGRLKPLFVTASLRQRGPEYNLNEQSQRARGFFFSVLGSVAALMAGADELLICENGVGAINLPISDAQLGVQSSRATHPVAISKLAHFLQSLLERQFQIRLPYIFLTKGEMLARLDRESFERFALRSVSCDGFPPRQKGAEQCGLCSSCLLRRQALWSAGYSQDLSLGQYRRDVLGDLSSISWARLAPLWDMLVQVDRLRRALLSPTPWQSLVIEFPELQEVSEVLAEWPEHSERVVARHRIVGLYKKYVEEWENFPARPPGWSFTNPSFPMAA